MALPEMDEKQRAAALKKAAKAREKRSKVMADLKEGNMTVAQAIKKGATDDVIGHIKVEALIMTQKGYGKAKATKLMEEIGIAEGRRVKGLGSRQAEKLKEALS